MSSGRKETTDDTSIKPVSSLRSHFERIGHHEHPFQSLRRSKTPDNLPHIGSLHSDTHHDGYLPLNDLRVIPPSSPSSAPSSPKFRQSALNPSTSPAPALAADFPRNSRSLSTYQNTSAQHSPPRVIVQSPDSPVRANGVFNGSSAVSVPRSSPVKSDQQDWRSKLAGPTLAPFPNRATKPESNLRLESRLEYYPGIPKPTISFQTPPTTTNAQQGLEAENSTIKDRTSPFNTPPGSDNGLSTNVVEETPPMEEQHALGQAAGMKIPRTMGNPSPTQRPALPPRPEVGTRHLPEEISHKSKSLPAKTPAAEKQPHKPSQPMPGEDFDKQHLISFAEKPVRRNAGSTSSYVSTRNIPSTSSIAQQLQSTGEDGTMPCIGTQAPTRVNYNPKLDEFQKGSSTVEFPEGSQPNRRPPYLKTGNQIIHATYETKLLDVCAGKACSAGLQTRVWDLSSGKMILSLALGEREGRASAVAFKPASKTDEEGSHLWIGTTYGDLREVDIMNHKVVSSKSAHGGREVIRIHRYQNAMWTLDEEGSLYVWPPGESGLPTLESRPVVRKLPRGCAFSIVIRGALWVAVGKELQVFRPSVDEAGEFKPVQQPPNRTGSGEITSGAVLAHQLDKVYFSHSDGNISIYSVDDRTCLGIVSVSVYKINCLVGAGMYVWAGYNTGNICVYDTRSKPWKVVKQWHAHEGPVANLSVDRTGLWTSGSLRVGSIGLDNTIKLWDGLLEDDWLEAEMQEHDASWCHFREIDAVVMTWNAGASTPASLRYEERGSNMLRLVLPPGKAPDLLVFGFQELVDLEDKRLTAKTLFKGTKRKDGSEQEHMSRQYRDWRDHLVRSVEDYMPMNESYALLHTSSMVGLFSCVFVKASQRPRVSNLHATEIKRGMGGLHGNKGALILRFHFDNTSICLINCHLAAGQTQIMHRNNDVTAILESSHFPPGHDTISRFGSFVGGGDGSMILDHEICILNGDLNYRIDTMPRDAVIKAIQTGNLAKLLERDQLLMSRRKNPTFGLKAFTELAITFNPTYKYDVGSDTYDSSEKHRAPAWCDRILYHGPGTIKQLDYRRHEIRISDHRPVSGTFRLRTKTVIPGKRKKVVQECLQKFQAVRTTLERETKVQYLRDVLGLSVEEARGLIQVQSH